MKARFFMTSAMLVTLAVAPVHAQQAADECDTALDQFITLVEAERFANFEEVVVYHQANLQPVCMSAMPEVTPKVEQEGSIWDALPLRSIEECPGEAGGFGYAEGQVVISNKPISFGRQPGGGEWAQAAATIGAIEGTVYGMEFDSTKGASSGTLHVAGIIVPTYDVFANTTCGRVQAEVCKDWITRPPQCEDPDEPIPCSVTARLSLLPVSDKVDIRVEGVVANAICGKSPDATTVVTQVYDIVQELTTT